MDRSGDASQGSTGSRSLARTPGGAIYILRIIARPAQGWTGENLSDLNPITTFSPDHVAGTR